MYYNVETDLQNGSQLCSSIQMIFIIFLTKPSEGNQSSCYFLNTCNYHKNSLEHTDTSTLGFRARF